jgi:hypothetical protein
MRCPCRYGVACCNNKHYNKEINAFLSQPDEAGEFEFTSKHISAMRATVMSVVQLYKGIGDLWTCLWVLLRHAPSRAEIHALMTVPTHRTAAHAPAC